MRRIKKVAFLSIALVTSLLTINSAKATSYFDGNGNAGSGSGSPNGQGINWDANWVYTQYAVAWFRYTFKENAAYGSGGKLPFDYYTRNNINHICSGSSFSIDCTGFKHASFSADCLKYSDTFYLSGNVLVTGTDGKPGDGHTTKGYKNMLKQSNYHGLYFNLMRQNKQYYVNETIDITNRLNSNDIPSSVEKVEVVPYSTVEEYWNTTASKLAEKSGYSTDFSKYTNFCGGEKAKEYGYYNGNALIKVNHDGINDTEFGGDGDTQVDDDDATPTVVISSGTDDKTIYYKAYGKSGWDNSGEKPGDDYSQHTGTKFQIESTVDGGRTELSGQISGNISDNYHANEYKSLTISPGDTKTICAVTYYHVSYLDGTWGNVVSDPPKACVTVKYINIEAELGSVTELKLKDDQNNVARAMGYNTSVAKSNLGNDIDSVALSATNYSQEASLNINPGQVTLSSLHKVTKVITQGDDINLTLRDVKIKGTNSSGVQSQTSCTDNVIKSGLSYVDCYKTSGGRNETVYPQDTVTYNVSTTTPTKINSGGVVNGTEKTSSASITVTAGPVKCVKFDNAEIGVNAPFNYGRITLYGNNRQVSVGDINSNGTAGSQWKSSETVWLNPSNEISFYYDVCMGHQITNDKANNGVNDEYSVSTSDALIDKLYTARRVSKSIQKTKTTSPDINATEINTSALGRIKANYSLSNQKTDTKNIRTGIDTEQKIMLGHSVDNSMSWSSHGNHNGINSSDVTATLTLNTPYNYWLSVNPCTSSTMIFIGQKLDCTIYPKVNDRFNGDVGSSYKTEIKTTKHLVAKLMIDANVTADQVKSLNGTLEGDYTNIDSIKAHLTGGLGSGYELKLGDGDSELLTYDSSSSEEFKKGFKLDYGEIEGGEEVGAKYCFVSALYPSDSHNTGYNGKPEDEGNDKYAISKNANQSVALIGDTPGDGAKTRITVSCATIGKKPSVSIEGGSLSAGGQVLGYVTNYKNRKYGSWAEYDLLSDEVAVDGTDKGFGSGASFAYVNPTSSKNAAVDAINAGISATSLVYPQSYGNMESGKYGATEESNRVANVSSSATDSEPLSWKFATAIRKQFIENNEPTANTWRSINTSDITTSSALPTIGENTFYVLYSKGKITIDQDIENDAKKSVVVVYSEGGIDITDDVSRVDAFLIAYDPDKSIPPGIDTCHVERQNESGNYVDIARKGASNGNQMLLEYCSNPLQVNGAVLAHNITLDRVYGGGSEGKMDDLDPKYLVKRAEIFSYDPRIVFWSFDFTWNEKNANSSYVVELTPRL